MSNAFTEPYQESRIEDEPILGPVLAMPDGRTSPIRPPSLTS